MARKKTHEEFVQEIEKLYPNRYSLITSYNGLRKPIIIKRNDCGHIIDTFPSNMYYDSVCPKCLKLKNKQLFQENFLGLYGEDFDIVDIEEYENAYSKMHFRHKNCGTIIECVPHTILQSKIIRCPKCQISSKTVPYVNDIYTLDTEMYKMLKYKEDGHKYSVNSKYKTWFICPNCYKEHFKKIANVHTHGLCCERCNDNISFPEKYMGELLSQLNVSYIRQFNDIWTKSYRYDFKFSIGNNNYLIEMDGGFHYNETQIGDNTLDKVKIADKEKDYLAKKNNYCLIRINCDYCNICQRDEFIRNNISSSELSNIFDLNSIDFEKCNKIAQSSFIKLVADKWNNGIKSYGQLANIFSLSEATIRNYIKIASDIQLIPETYLEIKKKNGKERGIKLGNRVKCNETNEVFSSFREADRKYNCNISMYFSKPLAYTGLLEDGTKLTWTKI